MMHHNVIHQWARASLVALSLVVCGCGGGRAPIDEPVRYQSIEKLKERLTAVSQYGDGGSSLGGIPESIDELLKDDPEKGKILLADFQRLNTASDKETRKQIAKEMMEKL